MFVPTVVGKVSGISFESMDTHTSISLLASGFSLVYCMMFPFGIHGLMMQNGNTVSETSMMGSTF
jgi:hypothetical protein